MWVTNKAESNDDKFKGGIGFRRRWCLPPLLANGLYVPWLIPFTDSHWISWYCPQWPRILVSFEWVLLPCCSAWFKRRCETASSKTHAWQMLVISPVFAVPGKLQNRVYINLLVGYHTWLQDLLGMQSGQAELISEVGQLGHWPRPRAFTGVMTHPWGSMKKDGSAVAEKRFKPLPQLPCPCTILAAAVTRVAFSISLLVLV